MKLLLDTNVLIDVLAKRAGFYRDSLETLRFCEAGGVSAFVSAVSVADVMYIMRKYLPREALRNAVKTLLAITSVADVTRGDINNAFSSAMSDYEDAVQAYCAKRIRADFIITRNTRDFAGSPVKAVTPSEFLKMVSRP